MICLHFKVLSVAVLYVSYLGWNFVYTVYSGYLHGKQYAVPTQCLIQPEADRSKSKLLAES